MSTLMCENLEVFKLEELPLYMSSLTDKWAVVRSGAHGTGTSTRLNNSQRRRDNILTISIFSPRTTSFIGWKSFDLSLDVVVIK